MADHQDSLALNRIINNLVRVLLLFPYQLRKAKEEHTRSNISSCKIKCQTHSEFNKYNKPSKDYIYDWI